MPARFTTRSMVSKHVRQVLAGFGWTRRDVEGFPPLEFQQGCGPKFVFVLKRGLGCTQ